jgi:hypothetical protein
VLLCAGLGHFVPFWASLGQFVPVCATLCRFVLFCATLCQVGPKCATLCRFVQFCATLCRLGPFSWFLYLFGEAAVPRDSRRFSRADAVSRIHMCGSLCRSVPVWAKMCHFGPVCALLCRFVLFCAVLCSFVPFCALLCRFVLFCALLVFLVGCSIFSRKIGNLNFAPFATFRKTWQLSAKLCNFLQLSAFRSFP